MQQNVSRPPAERLDPDLPLPENAYIDCGDYWLSTAPQRSPSWFSERENRLTMSNLAAALGLDKHVSLESLLDQIVNRREVDFDPAQQASIDRGVLLEPKARDLYARRIGRRVTESGIAIPKWLPWIGGSDDGEPENSEGLIEIKCPDKIYSGVVRYLELSKIQPDIEIRNYIAIKHYCQMQGNMAIRGKKWTDYILYSEFPKLECYVVRVNFNLKWWNEVAWPKLVNFINRLRCLLHPDLHQKMVPLKVITIKELISKTESENPDITESLTRLAL